MTGGVEFASVDWNGRPVALEYCRPGIADADEPLLVFLHEGLGSLAMWKDFPARLCDALECRGLVYSRPGYGQSTPRAGDENWDVDFMHRQAYELLPAFLRALDIDAEASPPWLFGHSDGASIALLYAARFPARAAGAILLAPHIRVEAITVRSIEQARRTYLQTDLRARLGKYHADPDSAFWGWNDIWLAPAFRDWSIEDELERIRCPLLAIQGKDDEYGTLEQIRGIARRTAQSDIVELDGCGHSPHRDRGDTVIEATRRFIAGSRQGLEKEPAGNCA